MTHICVMSSHKPIRIYMGGLILGANTLYRLFCFFKLFPKVGKGLHTTRGCTTLPEVVPHYQRLYHTTRGCTTWHERGSCTCRCITYLYLRLLVCAVHIPYSRTVWRGFKFGDLAINGLYEEGPLVHVRSR